MAIVCVMSALPPKADIDRSARNAHFVPRADIYLCGCRHALRVRHDVIQAVFGIMVQNLCRRHPVA
jgi:hypothetical protein